MSENCPIIAIDPGNTQSGYCVIDQRTLRPLEFGKIDNAELMQKLASATEQGWRWAVIEMVASCPLDRPLLPNSERLLLGAAAVPYRGKAAYLPQHTRQ